MQFNSQLIYIWLWNLTKWRATSSPFWSLNLGRYALQYILGILFGKPEMWAWFIGAYLIAIELILMMKKLNKLLTLLQPFNSGVSIEHYEHFILCIWSLEVKYAWPSWCLTIFHHQQSNLQLCSSYPGKIWTLIPQYGCQYFPVESPSK